MVVFQCYFLLPDFLPASCWNSIDSGVSMLLYNQNHLLISTNIFIIALCWGHIRTPSELKALRTCMDCCYLAMCMCDIT